MPVFNLRLLISNLHYLLCEDGDGPFPPFPAGTMLNAGDSRQPAAVPECPSSLLLTLPCLSVVCVVRNLEDKELACLPLTTKSVNAPSSVDSPPAPVGPGGRGINPNYGSHTRFCTLGHKGLCLCPSLVSSASSHETMTG